MPKNAVNSSNKTLSRHAGTLVSQAFILFALFLHLMLSLFLIAVAKVSIVLDCDSCESIFIFKVLMVSHYSQAFPSFESKSRAGYYLIGIHCGPSPA